MKRSLQVFMTREDERALSHALRAVRPAIKVFDDNIWSAEGPTTVESIDLAASHYVYLFPSDIFAEFPTRQRPDGRIAGPSSGCVVQLSRCSVDNEHLLSGAIGTGWEDGHPIYSRMESFWNDVANVMKGLAVNKLVSLFPETLKPAGTAKAYWCFSNAAQWVTAQPGRVLKDRAAAAFFQVPSRSK